MTITIPTRELITIISDALVFAPADKDAELYGIQLRRDGSALRAAGYDVLSGAESSWYWEQETDSEDAPVWGPDDEPGEPDEWSVFLPLPDAKEIVKTYKLAPKFGATPVHLDFSQPMVADDGESTAPRLYLTRQRHPWCTAHSLILQTVPDVKFLSIGAIIDAASDAMVGSTAVADDADPGSLTMSFNPARLAQFGRIFPHGVALVRYLGREQPTIVHVGGRVRGFVFPAGAVRAADLAMRAALA